MNTLTAPITQNISLTSFVEFTVDPSRLSVRPYIESLDGGLVPATFEQQPEAIEMYRQAAANGDRSTLRDGAADPDTVVFATLHRKLLERAMDTRTHAFSAYVSDLLQNSRFQGLIMVAFERSKTAESTLGKGERLNGGIVHDIYGVQLVAAYDGVDRSVVRDALEYIAFMTGSPAETPDGKPAICEMGNEHSDVRFSGQQAKVRAVVGGQLILGEVQGYTREEIKMYILTHGDYEQHRGYDSDREMVEAHRAAAGLALQATIDFGSDVFMESGMPVCVAA